MPRRASNLNSLSRGKVRASMNKYNLFNLYKKKDFALNLPTTTLFQQKWNAKQETRAYHGEHLTESRFKTIFSPNLETVAQLDNTLKGKRVAETPLPLQTYATLEKRLEFALFRSMFASSIRQARQFILSGNVTVNGVVVKHPSFPLQPMDIFHVKPEKVLMALGRVKPSLDFSLKVDKKQINAYNARIKLSESNPELALKLNKSKNSLNTIDTSNKKKEVPVTKLQNITRESVLLNILLIGNSRKDLTEEDFSSLKHCHKSLNIYNEILKFNHDLILNYSIDEITNFINKKQPDFKSNDEFKLARSIKSILGEIQRELNDDIRLKFENGEETELINEIPKLPIPELNIDEIKQDESKALINLPGQSHLFGRLDPTKPYFTPWTPRPFIGCFAILPAHIEISFATCHAIYLRDPIARPGHSEVITPFPIGQHERAYMYYSRKGM